jgi:Protein of unknown function (DUF3396)
MDNDFPHRCGRHAVDKGYGMLSFFDELDAVRIPTTRGRTTRTVARVVFSMMFFIGRSQDPVLRRQLLDADDYCRRLIPLSHYRWAEAEGETGKLYDLRNPDLAAAADRIIAAGTKGISWYVGRYDFEQTEGEAPGHALQYATDLTNDRTNTQSRFQLNIPLPWFQLQNRSGLAQKIFQDLTVILNPLHAQGGLSLATAIERIWVKGAADDLYPLLSKYPGLMNGWAADSAKWLGKGMQTVNWLNAVHLEIIDICGGADRVTQQLGLPGFVVTPYDTGLIIQAGPTPQLGNRETNEKIAHYGAVARALKPARVANLRPGWVVSSAYRKPGSADDDSILQASQEEYLTRFDDM